jgi:RNA polymerase sigma factor (sigma-70 family)
MGIKDTADLVKTRISSVNDEVGEDGDTAMEIGEIATTTASVNDYEKEVEHDAKLYAVEKALSVLSPRDKEIITLSFGLFGSPQYDNDAIAEKFGMSSENVRLLKIKALKRIQLISNRIAQLA